MRLITFRRLSLVAWMLSIVVITTRESSAEQIFWTSNGANNENEIKRANTDGSNIQPVLPPRQSTNVLSIAVDARDGTIFFGRWAADYTIERRDPNGSVSVVYDLKTLDPLQPNVGNNTATPHGLSIDGLNNKLYWSAGENPSHPSGVNVTTFIQRSNFDGTNVEILRQGTSNQFAPTGIVVDGVGAKIYWADQATDAIRRSNLDGSSVANIVTSVPDANGLAIDFDDQRMFWTEPSTSGQGRIRSAKLDGTDVQTVVSTGLLVTTGISVDPLRNLLYFTDDHFQQTARILRSNYDGSNLQELVANQGRAWAVAYSTVPEPSTCAMLCCAAVLCAAMRIRQKSG